MVMKFKKPYSTLKKARNWARLKLIVSWIETGLILPEKNEYESNAIDALDVNKC